ncbi:MAG TPA: alcohol dehydrogenase catalytic domain-containing protein, partial [Stenomitos sp.]
MYKYVSVVNPGGPEALELRQSDVLPEPKDDQVRIKVETAGVAFPDLYFRTETLVQPGIYPMTPGYDAVGVIDKLGKDVKDFKIGQRVIRVSSAFGYTEVLCNRANDLVLVPRKLESGIAVGLGINGVM